MKTAVAFPGQASQEVGMGLELKEKYPIAAELFKRANDVLGFDISGLIAKGPLEELTKTENAQPAILLVSYAAYLCLKEETGLRPDFLLGHSLGEYSALCASGALGFEDALRLVRLRGKYMQEACPEGEGAMAAVIGIGGFKTGILVDKARYGQVLDLANYNAPDQLVISGKREAVERACALAPELGAKKCMMLNVSAPFHSELMAPAVAKFRPELEKVQFRDMQIPVIANYFAAPYPGKEAIVDLLTKQVDHPVLYYQSIEYLIKNGVNVIIETGPGKVLTGLNKRIVPKEKEVAIVNFGKPEDIGSVRAVISGGVTGA